MTTRWPLFLLLILPLAACETPPTDDDDATDDGPAWEGLPGDLQGVFDAEAEDLGATGAAVAIWHDGVLYAAGTGTKSPDGDVATEPTTLFRIGSTTKVMTSTALLAAADRGDVAMTDAVVDHIPGLDIAGDGFADVQLHHLLSHTSGISEITPLNGSEDDDILQSFTTSQFGFAGQTWMMAPPGSFWNYSNPNFALAGAVNEAADTRTYRTIMREDVFAPLGMDRTLFLGSEVADDGDFAESETYDWDNPASGERRIATATSYDHAWSRPAGFAWSSVLDMVLFGRFLLDGDTDVLTAGSHAELVANQANMLAYLDYAHYGYGVMNWSEGQVGDGWYELGLMEHGGAIPGYAADLFTVPGEGFVMAVLAAGDGAYFGDLKEAAIQHFLGASPIKVPDPQAPTDLSPYVGTYEDPYNVGTIIVSLDGDGDLQWQLPRFDDLGVPYQAGLVPSSRGTFAANIQGNWTGITFISADGTQDGPARFLRHRAFVGDTELVTTTRAAPDAERIRRTLANLTPRLD